MDGNSGRHCNRKMGLVHLGTIIDTTGVQPTSVLLEDDLVQVPISPFDRLTRQMRVVQREADVRVDQEPACTTPSNLSCKYTEVGTVVSATQEVSVQTRGQ